MLLSATARNVILITLYVLSNYVNLWRPAIYDIIIIIVILVDIFPLRIIEHCNLENRNEIFRCYCSVGGYHTDPSFTAVAVLIPFCVVVLISLSCCWRKMTVEEQQQRKQQQQQLNEQLYAEIARVSTAFEQYRSIWCWGVGKRAFPVSGANFWNSLPSHVTCAPSLAVFRQRLKTFLFHLSYPDLILWLSSYLTVDLAITFVI